MAKPYLSVIIPAYNEARRLPLTLIDVDRHLSEQEYSYEIIVVSDGSTDQTAMVVERFKPLIENLKLLNNKENAGKGFAVRQGMLAAKGNWRLFMDADNSTSVLEFNRMRNHLERGYEIVIGSRAVRGAKLNPPQFLHKQIAGKLGNLFIKAMVLRGIKDTQCGFKCFSEESARHIFSMAKIDRWAFDVEAMILAEKLGYKVKEMPIRWVNDRRSLVSIKGYFQALWDIWRLRWWLWRKSYRLPKNPV